MSRIGITRRSKAMTRNPGAGPKGEVYAALDLGTNNCRLLVARPAAQGFRVIDAFSRIVRLGEGLSASGRLSEAAMDRTLTALKICAHKIDNRRVTSARYVATEACRRAENCKSFLDRVEREAGLRLEIISNREEANLGLQSCLPLLQGRRQYGLVFDIGGGSTEISWLRLHDGRHAEPGEPVEGSAVDHGGDAVGRPRANGANGGYVPRLCGLHSLPVGVVALAERYGGDRISPAAYEDMIGEVEALLMPLEARASLSSIAERSELQMLGTSGTVTTLAGVQKRLPRYQRSRIDGCYLDLQAALQLCRRIASMSYDQRSRFPCIGRERADLVVAGCAIFEAICRTWPVPKIRVADRGLREGMIFTLMGRATRLAQPPESLSRLGAGD